MNIRRLYQEDPWKPYGETLGEWVQRKIFDDTTWDGLEVLTQGFEIEGEVVDGELAAVIAIELVATSKGGFNLQIKSGIVDTQKAASKEFQILLLRKALEALLRD